MGRVWKSVCCLGDIKGFRIPNSPDVVEVCSLCQSRTSDVVSLTDEEWRFAREEFNAGVERVPFNKFLDRWVDHTKDQGDAGGQHGD